MSLEKFMSYVKSEGLIRNSRFTVIMQPPTIFRKNTLPGTQDLEKILLFCEAANIPALSVATIQNRTYGETREIPYDYLYESINLSFYADNSMQVKQFFDTWINNIRDPITRTYNYYNDYITDITIKLGTVGDESTYLVKLYECYPKSISSVELNQNGRDVIRINVNIVYKYWISEGDSSSLLSYETKEIPDEYFTDFNSFQASFNSTERVNPSLVEPIGSFIGFGREIIV